MKGYQEKFIRFIAKSGALRFGEFTTKSGRNSPYFFNAGGLNRGADLQQLGGFYAEAMLEHFGKEVDIIFGPAYKGIPLSAAMVMSLATQHQLNVSYCFNRKEAKDHGEGGSLVGKKPEAGERVVIVDDVITAGLSIRESVSILKNFKGVQNKGVIVALDRQEKGVDSELSAIEEVQRDLGLSVKSIVSLKHIIEILEDGKLEGVPDGILEKILEYREQYGVK